MKKILLFLVAITSFFALTSCSSSNRYEEEAGVYNLYYIDFGIEQAEIDLDISMFEYARITLYPNGFYLTETKSVDSQVNSEFGTYIIEDGKIKFGTFTSIFTGSMVCDYIDGEIHFPETSFLGITFSAKFKRD